MVKEAAKIYKRVLKLETVSKFFNKIITLKEDCSYLPWQSYCYVYKFTDRHFSEWGKRRRKMIRCSRPCKLCNCKSQISFWKPALELFYLEGCDLVYFNFSSAFRRDLSSAVNIRMTWNSIQKIGKPVYKNGVFTVLLFWNNHSAKLCRMNPCWIIAL